jgi:serine protease Do
MARREGPAAALRLAVVLAVVLLIRGRAGGEAPDAARRHLDDLSQAFRQAYLQAAPAVVAITTRQHSDGRRRVDLPPFHPEVPEGDRVEGMGSGTIVDPEGYILSNHHVIAGADSITVTLADRRVFQAEVVGADSLIDIALLRIHAGPVPWLRLGNSDSLQIGDWVLAIGHPLGQGSTLTHGIVSALGRQAQVIGDRYGIESFIQTDAVINPGNSGGPLLDAGGVVVGINTAITTRTGYYMGYGLAVPSNLALEAMRDLLAYGHVVRGFLGVEMEEVTQALNERLDLGLERPMGVYLQRVLPNSPVERSGLLDGDILLAVNGRAVDHPNQVQARIYGCDPGETVALTIRRRGTQLEVPVCLGEREDDQRLERGRSRLEQLGLTLAPLTSADASRLGFTAASASGLGLGVGQRPVRIAAIAADRPAAQRGLQVDDLVFEVEDRPAPEVAAVWRALAEVKAGESAVLWVWRPGAGVDLRVLPIED